jgi:hypothetical protein
MEPAATRLDEAAEVFAAHDADRDGRVTARQAIAALAALGLPLTAAEAAGVARHVDRAYLGLATLAEFRELLAHVVAPAVRPARAYADLMKEALATHAVLPAVGTLAPAAAAGGGGARAAAPAPAAAPAATPVITDAATLRALLTSARTGDGVDERTVQAVLGHAAAAGAAVGATLDASVVVDAVVAAASRTVR